MDSYFATRLTNASTFPAPIRCTNCWTAAMSSRLKVPLLLPLRTGALAPPFADLATEKVLAGLLHDSSFGRKFHVPGRSLCGEINGGTTMRTLLLSLLTLGLVTGTASAHEPQIWRGRDHQRFHDELDHRE